MSAVEEFKNQIQSLQEVDIGDFRRKIILYINRLHEATGEKYSKTIHEMKKTVLYNSLTDSEEILEQLLHTTKNIK